MAAYTKPETVQESLARDLARVGGNAASVAESVIEVNIERASAEIDGRLYSTYNTPFADPVPPIIEDIASSIACYLTAMTFRENRDFNTDLSPILLRYQRAQELLSGLATGSLQIPVEGVTPETGIGQRVVSSYTRGRLFSQDEFDIEFPNGASSTSPDYMTAESWAIHDG